MVAAASRYIHLQNPMSALNNSKKHVVGGWGREGEGEKKAKLYGENFNSFPSVTAVCITVSSWHGAWDGLRASALRIHK